MKLVAPSEGFVAKSANVEFIWEDPSKPNAVYDLHIFSDAARTQKLTGTNGVVFDTKSIGTANSHTFTHDPADGEKRYGRLWQWKDATYDPKTKTEILFEYVAYTKKVNPGTKGTDFNFVKALVDAELPKLKKLYTSLPMDGTEGYFSASILYGCANAYRATEDPKYLAEGLRIGQNWIDSGVDLDGNGLKDWWDYHAQRKEKFINYDHHEYRAASGLADVLIELMRTGYEGNKEGRIEEWASFLKKHVWEKWAPGHKLKSGIYIGHRNDVGADYVGRWLLIAVALDKAQAAGIIPANLAYAEYIESPSGRVGEFVKNYITKYGGTKYTFHHWTSGGPNNKTTWDTSHSSDMIYPILRSKQLGYNAGGKIEQFLVFYQAHLDAVWFPTSAGFTGNADGTGGTNKWHDSGSRGQALAATLSPKLKARWIDMVRNHKPTFTFWPETGYNIYGAMAFGGALLWALIDGNTIK